MSRRSKTLCLKTLCLSIAAFAAVVAFTVDWSISQEKKPAPSKRPPTAEEAILQALDQPTEFAFEITPLSDVMEFLEGKHKIQIRANNRALEDCGIVTQDTLVTRSLKGIKLRSAFNLILEELGLAFIIRDEVLLVTSKDDADVTLDTKVYPIVDLLRLKENAEDDESDPDYDSLIEVIEEIIQPDSWQDTGGPGTITALRGTLVILQTQDVHREIAALLDALRKARRQQDEAKGDARFAVIKAYDHQANDKLSKALLRRGSFSFAADSLSEVCTKLIQQYSVPIEFNRRALEDAGIVPEDTEITLKVSGVSLSSALNLMLEELGLAWVIKWEVLMITSKHDATESLEPRIYPIRDILFETNDEADHDFGSVIEAIQNCVQPDSWVETGSLGSISEARTVDSLVCTQTQQVHAEIEKLLADLRKVMPVGKVSRKEADEKVILMVYDVIVPPTYSPKGKVIPNPKAAELVAERVEQAVKIIPDLVAPGTWSVKDGLGYIRGMSDRVVVRQTRKVQRQVRKLLVKLGLITSPYHSEGFGGSIGYF